MTVDQVVNAIATLGFPIAVACFLLWERYRFYAAIVDHQARESILLCEIRDLLKQQVSTRA